MGPGRKVRPVVAFHTSFNPLTHKSERRPVEAATSEMLLKEPSIIITPAQSRRDLMEEESLRRLQLRSAAVRTFGYITQIEKRKKENELNSTFVPTWPLRFLTFRSLLRFWSVSWFCLVIHEN